MSMIVYTPSMKKKKAMRKKSTFLLRPISLNTLPRFFAPVRTGCPPGSTKWLCL